MGTAPQSAAPGLQSQPSELVAVIVRQAETLDARPFYDLEEAKFWGRVLVLENQGAHCVIRGTRARLRGEFQSTFTGHAETLTGEHRFVWTEIGDGRENLPQVQGLTAMDARLAAEGIPHEVQDAGGDTMIVKVPLTGTAWLLITRGDRWTGDDGDEDGWDVVRYLDAAGERDDAFIDNMTMTEAIDLVRSARGKTAHAIHAGVA